MKMKFMTAFLLTGFALAVFPAMELARAEEATPIRTAAPPYKKITVDIGGSSNFSSQGSIFEAYIGVNYFLQRWLVWRNAPFVRSGSNVDTLYGLDTSLQGRYRLDVIQDFGTSALLGAGYRWLSQGRSAPIVEAGLGFHVQGMNISASAKRVFNTAAGNGLSNETLYSIGFSGGFSVM